MELTIHILEALILVGLGFAVVVVMRIAEDTAKVAEMLMDELTRVRKEQAEKKHAEEKARREVEQAAEELKRKLMARFANPLHVVDKPLDFPNGD